MKLRFVHLLLCLIAIIGCPSPAALSQRDDEITEIVLESTQGRSSTGETIGRAFKITLRRDGTALFSGTAGVTLMGEFTSRIPEDEFIRLTEFLNSRKYFKLSNQLPEYSRSTPPAGTELITVFKSPIVVTDITSRRMRKTITRETLREGSNRKKPPKEILQIEKAISDAAMRLTWKTEK